MAYQFTLPRRSIIGVDSLERSQSIVKTYGIRAFIVAGNHVTKEGIVSKVSNMIATWGIESVFFCCIIGEPTVTMINNGVAAFKRSKSDFIIAIGGGSQLDAAKAIAAMSVLDGSIVDYIGKEIDGDFPAVVLIPTTAGTGSEATKFTVVTDLERKSKILLKGEALLPTLAIIDPSFTMSMSKNLTAATGIDALSHAIEAYTSRKSNDMTDMFALSAIKKIFEYLPKAYSNGNDVIAREKMAMAAYEAGICINNSSVTIVHGMSRPIGALFHVPHGISNAMLIKECLSFVIDGCYKKFGNIGRTIGVASRDASDEEAANAFIKQLDILCKTLEIPTLREYGIEKEQFDAVVHKMAMDAMISGSPSNTIKEVAQKDLITIYNRLWYL